MIQSGKPSTYRAIYCDSDSSSDSHLCSPRGARKYLGCPAAVTRTPPRSRPSDRERLVSLWDKTRASLPSPTHLDQLIDSCIDACSRDACRIEGLTQMHHGAAGLHHWIAFIVLDQFRECCKWFTTAHIVLFILQCSKERREEKRWETEALLTDC